ncbi:hypothetical protein ACJZ2D_011040 [Fusarium nematophilum]
MNSLRFARAALRARPAAIRVPVQRRTYAEAIKLSLALPHQAIYKSQDVVQVNIPAESGEMGVLANHVPSIEQLKPGLVEIVEETGPAKQFFLSGGFATVQPNSILSINAVEGYPLEDFSADAIKAQIAEAQKVASGSGSEQDIAEAKIELEVLETLAAHAIADFTLSLDPMARSYATIPSRLSSRRSRPSTQTQHASHDEWIPAGIVSDRIHQLKNLANQTSDGERSLTAQRERESTTLGLPLEQTACYGIKSQRDQRSGAPVNPRDRHQASEPSLRKLRSGVSTPDLRTGHGRNFQREKSINHVAMLSRHAATDESFPPEPLHVPPSPLPSTRDSATVSSCERRQDAMEIFEQYGISRPEGWLSEDGSGIAELPQRNPAKVFQVCHSCGEPLSSQRYCPRCGHDSCVKCTGQAPGEDPHKGHQHSPAQHREHLTNKQSSKQSVHTTEEPDRDHVHRTQVTVRTTRHRQASRFTSGPETPRTPHWVGRTSRRRFRTTQSAPKPAQKKTIAVPTAISSSVKNNPFFVADREGKAQASEPTTTTKNAQAKRPTRLSNCVPRRRTRGSSSDSVSEDKCSDPGCRATHAGHHPIRHSIECAARRSIRDQEGDDEAREVVDLDEEQDIRPRKNSPLHSALEKKIDQLYHHAEDLHHSQHIMEHLAAGARNLERSVATESRRADRKDARSRMRDTSPNLPVKSPRYHSLSHDDVTTVGEDVVEHTPSTDARVPAAIESESHNLAADPAVDRELSPKSHEIFDDIQTTVAQLRRPHSIGQDRAFEAQREPVGPLRRSFPLIKTTSRSRVQTKLPQLRPSPTGSTSMKAIPSSRVQHPVPPPKKHSVDKDTEQRVHGVQDSPSRKPVPRKVPQPTESREREAVESTGISLWRKQLRKVDKSEDQRREKQLTPPIMRWRRSLSKVRRTPMSDGEKKDNCLFCYPSRSPSPEPADDTPRLVVEHQPLETVEPVQRTLYESSTPRLRLMDVEQSLARKSAEDLMEGSRSRNQQHMTTKEVKSTKHCRTTSHSSYDETETVTEIHNPRPLIPYNHVCAWRTRYMDLSAEVEQLKSEASSRPAADQMTEQQQQQQQQQRAEGVHVGVGTSFSHQCPDIDIEGLTIVMHMRGKDDLVINTNLKEGVKRG